MRRRNHYDVTGTPQAALQALIYSSPEMQLRQTPNFSEKMRSERMDGCLLAERAPLDGAHFSGRDLYSESIRGHLERVQQLIETDTLDELRLKPKAICAAEIRAVA